MSKELEFAVTITAWDIGAMPGEAFVIWRPHFVTRDQPNTAFQKQGQWHGMSPTIARELSQQLLHWAQHVESRAALNAPKRTQ